MHVGQSGMVAVREWSRKPVVVWSAIFATVLLAAILLWLFVPWGMLAQREIGEAWSISRNTNIFALSGLGATAFVISIVIKRYTHGNDAMTQHLVKHLLESLVPAAVAFALFVLWNMFYSSPPPPGIVVRYGTAAKDTKYLSLVLPTFPAPEFAYIANKAPIRMPVTLTFVNKLDLEWRISDVSKDTVRDVLYYFGLFNLDRPELNRRTLDNGGVGIEPFRIVVQKADFVNPGEPIGGRVLPSGMESMIRPGERIFGYAFINCPGCKRSEYWLYFKSGEGGWFSKARSGMVLPSGVLSDPIKTLDSLVPHNLRQIIK